MSKKRHYRRKRKPKQQGKADGCLKSSGKGKHDKVSFRLLPNPLAGLTEKEVAEAFRSMGAEYESEFQDSFNRLRKIVREHDPIWLISSFSTYFLSTPMGKDPEIEKQDPILQHHVELLQALTLLTPLDKVDRRPVVWDDVNTIEQLLKSTSRSYHLRRLATGDISSPLELRQRQVTIERLRVHTQAVRNWGYPQQIIGIVRSLFAPLENDIQSVTGLRVEYLIEMCLKIIRTAEDRLNSHRDKTRPIVRAKNLEEVIDRYLEARPDVVSTKEELLQLGKKCATHKDFAWLCVWHCDILLPQIYTFSLDEWLDAYSGPVNPEDLQTVLKQWSYEIGSLYDFEPEHIFLDNPIWTRPLIHVGNDTYMWPILGLFFHSCLELMEIILNANSDLVNRYEKRRANFLEDEIEQVMAHAFPTAIIHRGSIWHDPQTGKDFENDLLVVLDSYAIVIEAKSPAISPPARRGAPDRLQRDLKKLIVEPSLQADRFARFLQDNPGHHEFKTKQGLTNRVDTSQVRRVIRIGVTLEFLGPLATRLPELRGSGLISCEPHQLAPSISLSDLYIICEILSEEYEKLHYIVRRTEFEQHADYVGDELDLLSFYLLTGFNIGETEFNGPPLLLSGMSKDLDPYFLDQWEGEKKVPKPRPQRTKWWSAMLERIQTRRMNRWTELVYILLNVSCEDQQKFEEYITTVKRIVKKRWKRPGHRNQVVLVNGPPQRRDIIVGLAYKEISREERNRLMELAASDVMSREQIKRDVVIGFDIDRDHFPYSMIAVLDAKPDMGPKGNRESRRKV